MNIKSLERIHKLLKEDVKEKYAARDVLEIKRNEADSFDRTIEKAYQEAYAECANAVYTLEDFETEEW